MAAGGPSAAEQYMLELINQARANPVAAAATAGIDLNEGLSPGTIAAGAKQPLAFNPQLIDAARSHTDWMFQNQQFGHDEGIIDPGAQMRSAGYPFTGTYSWGQNIASFGETLIAPPLSATAAREENDLFVDASEPGRGHRLNILDPSFKEIGIGIGTGAFQGYNSVLTSQDFASESGNSFLTGVAYIDPGSTHFYQPGQGLGDITITATRISDQASFSTTSWSSGGYTLALPAGAYTVTATGDGLGTQVANNVSIASQNVKLDFTVASRQPNRGTTTPPGWLAGAVFRDRNANGTQDHGEGGLAGWRVFIDLNGDGKWQRNEPAVLTASGGKFLLRLAPGSYTLRLVMKKGYALTIPTTAALPVTVTSGQRTIGENFGVRALAKKKLAPAVRRLQI